MERYILLATILLSVLNTNLVAQTETPATQWPQFRGVDGQNRYSDQVPIEFGPGINELWSTEIAAGHSSPIIWGGQIFLTGADDARLYVVCLSRDSGKLQWQRDFKVEFETDYFHNDCSPASPTCCTDGERVYSYFGDYGVIAHDLSGNEIWQKRFAHVPQPFGFGSSPILHDGKLIVARDVPQFGGVFCFDAASGEEKWMIPRPGGRGSFSTPVVWKNDTGAELVVGGSGTLNGYDLDSGKSLWVVNNLPALACTSPVATKQLLVYGAWTTAHVTGVERTESGFDDDIKFTEQELVDPVALATRFDENGDGKIAREELPASRMKEAFRFLDANNDGFLAGQEITGFFNSPAAPGRNVIVGIRPGGRGDITETHVEWEAFKQLPYVASPVVHDDSVFYVKKGGFLTRVNLSDGQNVYTKRLGVGGEYYATPIAAGDKLIVCAERGTVFVVDPKGKMEVLSTNAIGGDIAATPAIVDNTLYLRTTNRLSAFRSK
ncbi:MAG: PQQ-binding-like beta-propeller repeat protein [Planctomycetales bacterium]|nr:PQQ-binding-like beta-propeller repeat protein [Planctomycetales bacterium]